MVRVAADRITGVFNASGPSGKSSLGELLQISRDVSGRDARFVWVDESFLRNHEVEAWSQLPLWVGEGAEYAGFSRFDSSRAEAAGLTYRPIAETVADTLSWAATRSSDHQWRAGLTPERESELLAEWRTSN
jgi:2'-hydroxyisoflavone reductase